MGGLELTLGPMYLGTILNVWLYGLIAIQASIYYASFPRDARWIKFMVVWLLTLETLNSAFDVGLTWRYTIALFGDLEGLRHSHWFLNIEPVMTVTISSTAQGFFAWRIVKLTGQKWLSWPIACTSFVQFAAGLGGSIGGFIVKDFDRYHELTPTVIVWLVSSVITDTMITSVLIWYLHTHRTGYSKTDDIISRLVRGTVQTGLMVTMWASANLILFLVMPDTTMYLLFQLPMCKLYTASLLSTLNARKNPEESSAAGGNSDITMAWRRGGISKPQSQVHSSPAPRRSEGFKTNIPLERSAVAIQIETMTSSHRDESYELGEYAARNEASSDIEVCMEPSTLPQAMVVLPKEPLSSTVSVAASMDSKTLDDTK